MVGVATGCVVLVGLTVMLTGRTQSSQSTTSTVVDASRAPNGPTRSTSSSSKAAAPDPASTAVSDLIGGQQAYVSGNIDASVQQLQAAVDANPNDPRALSDLGQVLVRTGRAREAVAYLDKAVSLKPDSWAYQFNRARAYGQLQQWGQAVDGYRAAARLFPDDYATHYNLAKALQASGDLGSALAAYEKAIELAPGQSDFQLSYGLALETANRPQDAAAAYRRYLELEPDSVTIYQMELPYNTVISQEILKDGGQSPIADWPTKKHWLNHAYDEFQLRGYRIASAYTLATTKKPVRFIYTDALWHGGDMIGLGVSSFSHFSGVHFQNAHSFEEYIALIEKNQLPLLRALTLTPKQKLIRELILQLKTGAVEFEYFKNKFGVDLWKEFESVFESLRKDGFVERGLERIKLTRKGLLQVDHFLSEFFEPELKAVRYV